MTATSEIYMLAHEREQSMKHYGIHKLMKHYGINHWPVTTYRPVYRDVCNLNMFSSSTRHTKQANVYCLAPGQTAVLLPVGHQAIQALYRGHG